MCCTGPGICPRYIVQPGDSLTSIAANYGLDLPNLVASVQACGGSTTSLTPGTTICFPGGELAACNNVQAFNGNNLCKFYVMSPGDSIASVASALNLFLPTLEATNPNASPSTIRVGDLLRLPPWNETFCGILPGNLTALQSLAYQLPPQAPTQLQTPPSLPPPLSISTPVSPAPIETGPANPSPSSQSGPKENSSRTPCRVFRARAGDTLLSLAALVGADPSEMAATNPDLAGGSPLSPGYIVRVPPYDPASCSFPVLVNASQLAQQSTSQPPVNIGSTNDNTASGGLPGPSTAPQPPAPSSSLDNNSTILASAATAAEGGGSNSNGGQSPDPSIIKNAVSDAASGSAATSNASSGGSGTQQGSIIMGVTIGLVALAIVAMLTCYGQGTGGGHIKKGTNPEKM